MMDLRTRQKHPESYISLDPENVTASRSTIKHQPPQGLKTRHGKEKSQASQKNENKTPKHKEKATVYSRKRRLTSLDAFRGFTVVLMIFVDNIGSTWPVLDHSPWNGIALADFVMPFFDFILGVSLVFSLKSFHKKLIANKEKQEKLKQQQHHHHQLNTNIDIIHNAKNENRQLKWDTFIKVTKRFLKLFIIGILTQGGIDIADYDLKHIRIMGILQRVALCYYFAAILEIFIPPLKNYSPNVLKRNTKKFKLQQSSSSTNRFSKASARSPEPQRLITMSPHSPFQDIDDVDNNNTNSISNIDDAPETANASQDITSLDAVQQQQLKSQAQAQSQAQPAQRHVSDDTNSINGDFAGKNKNENIKNTKKNDNNHNNNNYSQNFITNSGGNVNTITHISLQEELFLSYKSLFGMYVWHWVVFIIMVLFYHFLVYFVEVPDAFGHKCGAGVITPVCNVASYIDKHIFTVDHMYFPTNGGSFDDADVTFQRLPACSTCSPGKCGPIETDAPEWCTKAPYDPEGLVSSIEAVLTSVFGAHIGHLFVNFENSKLRLLHMMSFGIVLLLIGIVLHFSNAIKLNTDMYSFSYLVLTAGTGMIILSYFYVVMDVILVDYRSKIFKLEEQYFKKKMRRKSKARRSQQRITGVGSSSSSSMDNSKDNFNNVTTSMNFSNSSITPKKALEFSTNSLSLTNNDVKQSNNTTQLLNTTNVKNELVKDNDNNNDINNNNGNIGNQLNKNGYKNDENIGSGLLSPYAEEWDDNSSIDSLTIDDYYYTCWKCCPWWMCCFCDDDIFRHNYICDRLCQCYCVHYSMSFKCVYDLILLYPFECVGRNALLMYILAESGIVNWFFEIFYWNNPDKSLANIIWPTGVYWGPDDELDDLPNHASYSGAMMTWVLGYCLFWMLVAIFLHKNKIYYVV